MTFIIIVMSKSVQFFLTLLLILSAQDISQTNTDPLLISKVQNANSNSQTVSGGLLGGNKLNITGAGFDLVAQNNLVSVGSIPCRVLESTLTNLICVTEPTTPTAVSTTTVTVALKGKATYTCTNCPYTSSLAATPLLNKIYPRSG